MTYLFLAVPPFSGSTALHNYIAKCANVVPLTDEIREKNSSNDTGIVEGNAATQARTLYGDNAVIGIRVTPAAHLPVIQDKTNYDWDGIKTFLDANWEFNNPNALIRLQKTPNDTYRIQMMQPYFDAKWIIMVREPYAWFESTIEKYLKRRINPSDRAEEIVAHMINTYVIQKENQTFLGDKAYTMTFEDFVANEDKHTEGLKLWMPELSDLTFKGTCLVKQETVQGLTNNNAERVALLRTISGAINKFNELFKPHEAVLNSWGYELL
jgi:hypothetical protein